MKIPFLSQLPLFKGISPKELEILLPKLKIHTREYQKGEIIYHAGDKTNKMGILVNGKIQLETTDLWGTHYILQELQPKSMFAYYYMYLNDESIMVDMVSTENSVVVFLDADTILKISATNPIVIQNLFKICAQQNLDLSRKIYHTSYKTIRGRLRAYLSYEAKRQNDTTITIPFDRQSLADYLNVDRSALSNELSKMQKEGLLEVQKNHFTFNLCSLPKQKNEGE